MAIQHQALVWATHRIVVQPLDSSIAATTPVNVSGGIGTSRFAPVRIACKPEAVLLTLTARP